MAEVLTRTPPLRPTFIGFTVFLDPAADDLGLDRDSTNIARSQPALSGAANLIAQAYTACPSDQAEILIQARRRGDGLRVAAHTYEIMMKEAEVQLGLAPAEPVEPEPEPEDKTVSIQPVKRGPGRPRGTSST